MARSSGAAPDQRIWARWAAAIAAQHLDDRVRARSDFQALLRELKGQPNHGWLVADIQQRLGLTVAYVTHDQQEALAVSDRIIVMDHAAIAQSGTPRELYEAPASLFVADFVGDSNLIDAELTARNGVAGHVRAGGVEMKLAHRGAAVGPVKIAVRPESLRLSTVAPTGPALEGRVVKAAYLGTHMEYTVSTAVGELFVVDRGSPDDPVLVLLHGFPGSSFDWRKVVDQLVTGRRVVTFDFLGFTVYWCRTRRGSWRPGMKTRKARVQRALVTLGDWCRRHRHLPLKEQHAALSRRLRGHFQYFGVNGNARSLHRVMHRARQIWLGWLQRRSQRGHRLTWKRFDAYLKAHPLPPPQIAVGIWGQAP